MSMTVVTTLQVLKLLLIYTVLVIFIPDLLFHKKYTNRKFSERFMIDLTIGNFYIMNLVFFLQLLHISSVYTLIFFTLAPVIAVLVIQRKKVLKERFFCTLNTLNMVSKGIMGTKTFIGRLTHAAACFVKTAIQHIFHRFSCHKTEYFFICGMILLIGILYGTNEIMQYGYNASDLPVHNYWINEMSHNNIFAAGVYPFGFHCVIYYIHTVFQMDTYVILRLFAVVQTLYIHLVLYAFIRGICRSSFAVYAGMFLFIAVDLYHENCTIRYISALPQEYGMIFILPCIYFLFEFFRHQKENAEKKVIRMDLMIAIFCFSMTIAVHFYDTMIAGLFCVAIVIGFFVRFFRPRYLFRILGALILALLLGIIPMAAAVISGKPLQGSIGWGMNILTGNSSSSGSSSNSSNNSTSDAASSSRNDVPQPDSGTEEKEPDTKPLQEGKKRSYTVSHIYQTLSENIQINVFEENGYFFTAVILGCCGLLLIAGIGMCIGRQYDYGFRQISISIFILLLLVVFNAKDMGLPQLMDQNRSRIYLVYMLAILYAMVIDFPASLVLWITHRPHFMNGFSFLLTGFVCAAAIFLFGMRSIVIMPKTSVLETNGAIACLYNIIKEHDDLSWTIISANDELQMIDNHGYHYETITFLRYLKYAAAGQRVTIPTKYVYFYIEKVPLDYTVSYAGSGQSISREGAKKTLPEGNGINPYKGESRWIVMSKMYYWAEQFQKLFPQDMTVYYEDEEFICYQLIQNESSLYSLSIDYNYNQ